jgi:hypothetical protein
MVNLLWQAGDFTAAICLEEYWNSLLEKRGFSLFCSYAIDVFDREFRGPCVDALLRDHTHLISSADSEALESAIDRAMDERLGERAEEIRLRAKAERRTCWAELPDGEATILWLRSHLPDEAENIVRLARQYF